MEGLSVRMERRKILKKLTVGIATAGSVSLAGCSGDDDETAEGDDGQSTDSDGTTDTSDRTTDTSDGTTDTSDDDQTTEGDDGTSATNDDDQTESTRPELPTYEFTEGEAYTYDTFFIDSESEESWSVTSVDGDQVTVERQSTVDGETSTGTYSGTQDTIYDTVSQERDFALFPVARGATLYAQGRDLTAGSTFTIATPNESTDWDSETVEVNGETTVNGVTCTEITATPDNAAGEDNQRTACLADGYPFAVSMTIKTDGQALLEMTLTDATRP